MFDAKRSEQFGERLRFRFFKCLQQVGCAQFAEALYLQQLFLRQAVQVANVRNQLQIGEREHCFLAKTFNVHAAARCEVDDALIALKRARWLDTTCVRLALCLHQYRLQIARARFGKLPWLGILWSFL